MQIHQLILVVIIFTNVFAELTQHDENQMNKLTNEIATGLLSIDQCVDIRKSAVHQNEKGEYFLNNVEINKLFSEAKNWQNQKQVKMVRKSNGTINHCAINLTDRILTDSETIEGLLNNLKLLENRQELLRITDGKLKMKLAKMMKPILTKSMSKKGKQTVDGTQNGLPQSTNEKWKNNAPPNGQTEKDLPANLFLKKSKSDIGIRGTNQIKHKIMRKTKSLIEKIESETHFRVFEYSENDKKPVNIIKITQQDQGPKCEVDEENFINGEFVVNLVDCKRGKKSSADLWFLIEYESTLENIKITTNEVNLIFSIEKKKNTQTELDLLYNGEVDVEITVKNSRIMHTKFVAKNIGKMGLAAKKMQAIFRGVKAIQKTNLGNITGNNFVNNQSEKDFENANEKIKLEETQRIFDGNFDLKKEINENKKDFGTENLKNLTEIKSSEIKEESRKNTSIEGINKFDKKESLSGIKGEEISEKAFDDGEVQSPQKDSIKDGKIELDENQSPKKLMPLTAMNLNSSKNDRNLQISTAFHENKAEEDKMLAPETPNINETKKKTKKEKVTVNLQDEQENLEKENLMPNIPRSHENKKKFKKGHSAENLPRNFGREMQTNGNFKDGNCNDIKLRRHSLGSAVFRNLSEQQRQNAQKFGPNPGRNKKVKPPTKKQNGKMEFEIHPANENGINSMSSKGNLSIEFPLANFKDENVLFDEGNLKGKHSETTHLEGKMNEILSEDNLLKINFNKIENPSKKTHAKNFKNKIQLEESQFDDRISEGIQMKGIPLTKHLNRKFLKGIPSKFSHSLQTGNQDRNYQISMNLNAESPKRDFKESKNSSAEVDKREEISSKNLHRNEFGGESADDKIEHSKHLKEVDSILGRKVPSNGMEELKNTDNTNLKVKIPEEEISKELKENVREQIETKIPSPAGKNQKEEINSQKVSEEKPEEKETFRKTETKSEISIDNEEKLGILKDLGKDAKIHSDGTELLGNVGEIGENENKIHKEEKVNSGMPFSIGNDSRENAGNAFQEINTGTVGLTNKKIGKIKMDVNSKGNLEEIVATKNSLEEEIKKEEDENVNKQMEKIGKNEPKEGTTTFYVFSGENKPANHKKLLAVQFLPKKRLNQKLMQDQKFKNEDWQENKPKNWKKNCHGIIQNDEKGKFIVNWSECGLSDEFWKSTTFPYVPVLQMTISLQPFHLLKAVDFSVEMTNFGNLNGEELKQSLKELLKGGNEVEVNIENTKNPQLKFIDSSNKENNQKEKKIL